MAFVLLILAILIPPNHPWGLDIWLQPILILAATYSGTLAFREDRALLLNVSLVALFASVTRSLVEAPLIVFSWVVGYMIYHLWTYRLYLAAQDYTNQSKSHYQRVSPDARPSDRVPPPPRNTGRWELVSKEQRGRGRQVWGHVREITFFSQWTSRAAISMTVTLLVWVIIKSLI